METQQLTITANYASGDTEDVTDSATYSSSEEGVATVSSSGLITGVAEGSATITASFGGATGTCAVTVEDTLEGLSVSPAEVTLTLEE